MLLTSNFLFLKWLYKWKHFKLSGLLMKTIRIALAQINPTVGGIEGNVLKICDYIRKAREKKSSLVIFPELSITGYPP